MPENPPSTTGVFLSYAREDSDAARRIADALRAFGVEVWFDQSELRGGDAWDAKIKRQIRECALFVPIVSAHTQARGEGYFRREWKLAVERTHDMAAGVPFLMPIVIDDTLESEALVPDEVMRVQWTRLPHGVPTPQFVEQVKRLMENPRKPVGHGARPSRNEPSTMPVGKKKKPAWTMGMIVAVVAGISTAVWVGRKHEPPAAPAVAAAKPEANAPAAPSISDKSIAVLPFTNMSDEKDSTFFTDGMHEDILTNLALIRELRVVSRTSVMQYRETKKPMRQIAAELGVAYILEGSVRRAGNKVRVTGQLIHAATDEHVWAKAYDRDLTDIFAIQAELSQQIATALKAALSPEEKVMIARRPTENTVAYDLYLQARELDNRYGRTLINAENRTKLLAKAVELDPSFAQAWGELADVYAYSVFTFANGMDGLVAKAKAAIDQAVKLAPDDADVIRSLGTYYYYTYRDYAKAAEQYERLARRQPNDPTVFNSLGLIQRRQGNWAQSAVNSRRAVELDPASLSYLRNFEATLLAGNRYEEATTIQRRIVALMPDRIEPGYALAQIPFLARGSMREVDEFLAHLTPTEANSPDGIECRRDWAATRGDFAEAIRLDGLQPYYENSSFDREEQANLGAQLRFFVGDQAGVVARLGDSQEVFRRQTVAEPRNARVWEFLGLGEAYLGHKAEALRCAERAKEIFPESRDALDGVAYARVRVWIYDWAGDKELALAEFKRLLRVPYGQNVNALKYQYSTLRSDPRFEALLADPANNAPLF